MSDYYRVDTAGVRGGSAQLRDIASRVLSMVPLPGVTGAGEFKDIIDAIADFEADWGPFLSRFGQRINLLAGKATAIASAYDQGGEQSANEWRSRSEMFTSVRQDNNLFGIKSHDFRWPSS